MGTAAAVKGIRTQGTVDRIQGTGKNKEYDMDHKIERKKKSPWNGIIITLLILLLIGAFLIYTIIKSTMDAKVNSAERVRKSLEVETTKVKEGEFDLSLKNITGTIRSAQSVTLYWQTSGRIADISVEVGDHVVKDQVLAYLDETTLDQSVLNAQIDIEDARDDYDELVKNADQISSTLSTLVKAESTLDKAKEKLDSMDMSRVTDVNLLIARETAAKAELKYQQALSKFDALRNAPADDAGRKKALGDVTGYRNARDNALAEYNMYLGQVDELELMSREAAVKLAEADLEEAQYQYDKALKGPSEAKLTQAQAKIDAFQTTIDSSKIIAPFDGTVTEINSDVNDMVVYASDLAARNISAMRIDDLSDLYIDFTVSELYINDLSEGMPATIEFAAIPGKTYHGVVHKVADVGTRNGWNISFDITVKLTDADEKIKNGMTADVTLPIYHLDSAKTVPQSAVDHRDGKYFVNRKLSNGKMLETEVQVGLISGSSVQIISDEIRGGDEIQLEINAKEEGGFGFDFMRMFGGGGGMGGPGGGMGGPGGR